MHVVGLPIRLHRVALTVVVLSLSAALALLILVATPPAKAAAWSMPAVGHQSVRLELSSTEYEAVQQAGAAVNYAMRPTSDGHVYLDYAKAAQKFTSTGWRRRFAAGVMLWGTQINNISTAERDKVRAIAYPSLSRVTPQLPVACQGRNGAVMIEDESGYGNEVWDLYLDSCKSAKLERQYRDLLKAAGYAATPIAAFLARYVGPKASTMMAGAIVALADIQHSRVEDAIADSDIKAIRIRERSATNLPGPVYRSSTSTYYPQ